MSAPAWQKAWDCFLQTLRMGEFPAYCIPILSEQDGKFFKQLVKSVRRTGILVKFGYPGGILNNNGILNFPTAVTGCWRLPNPRPRDLRIWLTPFGKCTMILSHEFAHAVNFLLYGGYWDKRQMEINAAAASYLFVCRYFGLFSSSLIVLHARKWNIESRHAVYQKRQILAIYRKMNSLYRKGLKAAR